MRRWPDVEAPNLFAVDASDRLILDHAAPVLAQQPDAAVAVIGDRYGALTLGTASMVPERVPPHGIRVHQDPLSGERALAANAERFGLSGRYRNLQLGSDLVSGADLVLMQLTRELDALDEIVTTVAAFASDGVELVAGGRVKHMTNAMNEVIGRSFESVTATLARQKSRLLIAHGPRRREALSRLATWPAREHHPDLDLWVCARGAVFAGTRVDIGTRFLLGFIDDMLPTAVDAVDLGCGTGILAAAFARARPGVHVTASDQSAAAVASALATAEANGVTGMVHVVRDDGLESQATGSADLVMLNPPFHVGAAVHTGVAPRLFEHAARVLRPGGELWTVWNSHLAYRDALERIVGPTKQAGRNTKFTVTVSTR
ncbi:methyltransferase [Okibacterium endophyticum]